MDVSTECLYMRFDNRAVAIKNFFELTLFYSYVSLTCYCEIKSINGLRQVVRKYVISYKYRLPERFI